MKRSLVLSLSLCAAALLGGAMLYWRSEAMRTSGRIRRLAADLALATEDARARTVRVAELDAELRLREERVELLQGQLSTALESVRQVNGALETRREELEAEQQRFAERRARAVAPMPEGVRRAVLAFEECLASDGFNGFRLLDARRLDAKGFGDVELLEAERDHIPAAFWFAKSMALVLDREHGVLELHFREGRVVRNGATEELPADGATIRLEAVDGHAWERRLPGAIEAVGSYPEEAARRNAPSALDPLTRDAWRTRLARLLESSGTELNWDVGRFTALDGGRFVDASIHGYGKQDGLLAQSASVKHLAVEVDRASATVWLLLEDGVLRKAGGDTTIPAAGYRLLLPGVSPQDAVDAMLGMVVERR